jgi:hypothetical protein
MEVSGQLHTPVALPLGKESPVSIGQEAEWVPQPVWTRWRREKIPAPSENNPSHPALGLVTITTEVSHSDLLKFIK